MVLVCCSAGGAAAAPELELDRLVPVAAEEPIPISDFFRPALFTGPQLNPAGTHVGVLMSGGLDTYKLVVHEIATGESQVVGGLDSYDVYRFSWLNDHRLNFSLSYDKFFGFALGAVDLERLDRPYPILQYGGHSLVGIPVDDRLRPLVHVRGQMTEDLRGQVMTVNTDLKRGLFVNVMKASTGSMAYQKMRESNQRVVVKRHPPLAQGTSVSYGTDQFGALAYAIHGEDGLTHLHYLDEDEWRPSPIDTERVHVHSIGRNAQEMVASEHLYDGNPSELKFVSMVDGEFGETIFQDRGYDFTGSVIRDPGTRNIVGLDFHRATPAQVWFDSGYEALQQMFEQNFPQRVVRMVSISDDTTVFVLSVSSDRHPTSYFLVDLKAKSIGPLKDSRPWLDPERLNAMNIIKFKTTEGRQLDAYFTLPQGASKKNPAPLIVLPHGGPWVRDVFGFNSEVQFLASRGYAVLQPNYRGSPGTNWMFPEPDQWDFLKMHADVTAATKTALKTGLVDPERVAIMGGSFGAYLALSGAVHEPELYSCIVGLAGVYDWVEVMNDSRYSQYVSGELGFLKHRLGDPKKDPAKFRAISPIHFVENMQAPMFVSHGKDDPVASRLESQRLVTQLKKHDKVHESLFIAREGHGMAHLDNRVELYQRIEAFLAQHL